MLESARRVGGDGIQDPAQPVGFVLPGFDVRPGSEGIELSTQPEGLLVKLGGTGCQLLQAGSRVALLGP